MDFFTNFPYKNANFLLALALKHKKPKRVFLKLYKFGNTANKGLEEEEQNKFSQNIVSVGTS